VDYLWLSPINASPQKDNGYDISNYYAIDPMFGSLNDFKQLIQEARQRGMKIMMDLVLNHTSTAHEWFKKALQNDPVYKDFYYFDPNPRLMDSIFGGSAWAWASEREAYYFCYFDKTQADLNWENPKVRQELYKMVNYWINFGVEGFRLDVIDHISKNLTDGQNCRGPRYLEFLKELNQQTFRDKLLTVGECWGADLTQMAQMCHGEGLFQAFHFSDTTHTAGVNKWEQTAFNLPKLVEQWELWQNKYAGSVALVMNNHDSPRLISLWLNDNQYRYEAATLLITLYAFMRGNLYLYQGEEIGMTNWHEADIFRYDDVETLNAYKRMRADGLSDEHAMAKIMLVSRDNARVCMAWDDSSYGGFSTHKPWLSAAYHYKTINMVHDRQSERSIYRYYQQVLAYRKANYGLLSGKVSFTLAGNVLTMERAELRVVANFSATAIDYAWGGDPLLFTNTTGIDEVKLQPYQVVVQINKAAGKK
jgi:glycosidase